MYTRVITSTSITPFTAPTATTSTKEPAMRLDPSDVLFVILSLALLLAAGFVLGGLAAHPF